MDICRIMIKGFGFTEKANYYHTIQSIEKLKKKKELKGGSPLMTTNFATYQYIKYLQIKADVRWQYYIHTNTQKFSIRMRM